MKEKISSQEVLYFSSKEALTLFELWKQGNYKIKKTLKDSNRSYVLLLEIEGKYFVYKEPREKNRRKWQQFLSLFRGSESKREAFQMLEIENHGFLGPQLQFAYEKRKLGRVIHSFLLYSYIDAEEITVETAEKALSYLHRIHEAGFLHGDSQISNFLIHEEEIYIIDSKFQKNKYGDFACAYEEYYFELSCPICSFLNDRKRIPYRIAKKWKDLKEWWVKRKTKKREKK